jgi:hypothetical protein
MKREITILLFMIFTNLSSKAMNRDSVYFKASFVVKAGAGYIFSDGWKYMSGEVYNGRNRFSVDHVNSPSFLFSIGKSIGKSEKYALYFGIKYFNARTSFDYIPEPKYDVIVNNTTPYTYYKYEEKLKGVYREDVIGLDINWILTHKGIRVIFGVSPSYYFNAIRYTSRKKTQYGSVPHKLLVNQQFSDSIKDYLGDEPDNRTIPLLSDGGFCLPFTIGLEKEIFFSKSTTCSVGGNIILSAGLAKPIPNVDETLLKFLGMQLYCSFAIGKKVKMRPPVKIPFD